MKKFLTALFGSLFSLSLLSGCIVINMPGAASSSLESSTTQSEEAPSSSISSEEASSVFESSEESASSAEETSEEMSEESSSESEETSESAPSASSEEESSSEREETSEETNEEQPPVVEPNDFATNATFVSRAPENYGTHNTLTVQSEVVAQNSTAALMGVFNNKGAQVHNGYAIWTWACLCLEDYVGSVVDCQDRFLTYDVKVENGKGVSSLILVDPYGYRSREMTHTFDDPSKTFPGITCTALSDGWYHITVDFNTTFKSEPYVLADVSEILFMFTNEECENPDKDTTFYIDNMVFSGLTPDDKPNDEPTDEPDNEDTEDGVLDFTESDCISSRAPENYGVNNTSTVQSEVVSQNSSAALQCVFDNVDAETYKGYAVWTWAEICLDDYYNSAQNLKNKAITYDVKTQNCGFNSSIIVINSQGERTDEIGFFYNSPSQSNLSISCVELQDGWYRITIDFYITFFENPIIEDAAKLLIMFTNENCDDPYGTHTFYLDNMRLIDSDNLEVLEKVPVNNPSGYYKKSETLHVKIVGNSFVSPSFSNSAAFLDLLCIESDANVIVSHLSIGNARISNQYNAAFGVNGYMYTEEIDVLFIQDFYGFEDTIEFGKFLTKLHEVSPTTEVKIYAGENETEDGKRSSQYYGVDHVDWRNAIRTLKNKYGFTSTQLNAYDGWHPNELSGFVGSLMMYIELFGKRPNFETVKTLAKQTVWTYLLGTSDAEKEDCLSTIYTLAASYVLTNK